MPGTIGNHNRARHCRWRTAIERALEARSRRDQVLALDALAESLLQLCDQGDIAALKELGDRLDGKPTQVIAGDPEAPIVHEGVVRFVNSASA